MRLKATLLEYSKSTTKQIPSSVPGAAIPSDGGIINGLLYSLGSFFRMRMVRFQEE